MGKQRFPFPLRSANQRFPYNPFAPSGARGDADDSASYIQPPGVEFFQPWLAIPNGPAFIWPLGTEGWTNSIEPTLGIHKYYGDNKVVVNVTHRGEEHLTMSGNFIGSSSKDSLTQLKQVVYAQQPPNGKILYLPGILTYAQRVAIMRADFEHGEDARGEDMTYTIEFVRLGIENKYSDPDLAQPVIQPTTPNAKASQRVFKTTSTVNTIRKIAVLKKVTWQSVFNKNEKLFTKLKVPSHNAPDYHLKLGTPIYY